jgi:hypothetical protein
MFVPHTYPLHVVVLVWLQTPAPLQNDGGWYIVPLHDTAVPQVTVSGCCVHPPPPLQTPVLPHSPFGAQLPGSLIPAPTFEQVPTPFRLQAWQVEQPLVMQQTPSMQLPLLHWLPPLQLMPSPRFAVQLPPGPVQKWPPMQLPSLLQVCRQVVVPHT